ncbi:MAG: aldehyde dehydrogenase family protein, partial [Actinobacteria bacterium]|nr:aldehyde dehydrogenase family protein [Actinomycetota bacterium]
MNKTFTASNPATGESVGAEIAEWDQSQVLKAITSAHKVKDKLSKTNPSERASVLNSIADAIESEKDNLAKIANLETALPLPRLVGEVMRTVVQLRAFATLVKTGGHL